MSPVPSRNGNRPLFDGFFIVLPLLLTFPTLTINVLLIARHLHKDIDVPRGPISAAIFNILPESSISMPANPFLVLHCFLDLVTVPNWTVLCFGRHNQGAGLLGMIVQVANRCARAFRLPPSC